MLYSCTHIPDVVVVVVTLFVYAKLCAYILILKYSIMSNSKHKSTTQPTVDYTSISCNIHTVTHLKKKFFFFA